jgi:hypothetical protein
MDKFHLIYNYLSTRNYTYFLLLALLVKGLVADVSYSTVLLTVPVLCFEAYRIYIKMKTPEPVQIDMAIMKRFDQVQDDVDKLKSKVNANSFEKNIAAAPKRYF